MERKPTFIDIDGFLRDLNKRFEEEEFLSDFKNFLAYVVKEKIELTPKGKWIPMKHLYAINNLLRNPLKLDDAIGGKVYKTREEYCASKIYFIDLLACASQCIYINRKNTLMPGPEYSNFLNKDGFNKKRWLIFAWWFNLDWGIKCCILEPFSWLDIIELCYTKEDELGIKDIKSFYIKPMGKIFLEELVRMGEKIKEDSAKKSNCNNN